MNSSVRRALLIGTGIGTALLLSASGLSLYALVRSDLRAQFDDALLGKARLLASTVEETPLGIEIEFDDLDMREFLAETGPGFLQLWSSAGETIFRSPSLGSMDLPSRTAALDEALFQALPLPGGLAGRAICIVFAPRPEELEGSDRHPVTLVLARPDTTLKETLGRFRLLLMMLGLATLAAMSASLSWGVHVALKPLGQLAADIRQLDEHDLSVRLAAQALPAEIRPLVVHFNGLLDRLEGAFAREKSFSADVAHELRTPLAGLRSIIEVSLMQRRDAEAYREALTESLEIAGQLEHLVTDLLALARMEADLVEIDPRTLPIHAHLQTLWQSYEKRARSRGLKIEWELASQAQVISDANLLDIAIRNIFDNAVSHADENGTLTISTTPIGESLHLRVTNTGSHLTQREAEELCDRLRRGDRARTETERHCGLGLALVREVVRVLGGRLHLRSEPGERYEIILEMPLRPPPN